MCILLCIPCVSNLPFFFFTKQESQRKNHKERKDVSQHYIYFRGIVCLPFFLEFGGKKNGELLVGFLRIVMLWLCLYLYCSFGLGQHHLKEINKFRVKVRRTVKG